MANANVPIVAPGYDPEDYIVATRRNDGGACKCGTWMFYSATCRGVYQIYPKKCGSSLTRRGHNTAYCKGTSTRVLIAYAKVNQNCPAVHHPHGWDVRVWVNDYLNAEGSASWDFCIAISTYKLSASGVTPGCSNFVLKCMDNNLVI